MKVKLLKEWGDNMVGAILEIEDKAVLKAGKGAGLFNLSSKESESLAEEAKIAEEAK